MRHCCVPARARTEDASGKLRAIAATGPQRWPGLPDVPTVAEQGVVEYDVRSWAGLMAPAGTPSVVVDRLNAATLKALEVPEVGQKLADMGGEARVSTPEEMKALVASELKRWTQLVAEVDIQRQ